MVDTLKKDTASHPVNGLVQPPSSYSEYLLLSDKDKIRLLQSKGKKMGLLKVVDFPGKHCYTCAMTKKQGKHYD